MLRPLFPLLVALCVLLMSAPMEPCNAIEKGDLCTTKALEDGKRPIQVEAAIGQTICEKSSEFQDFAANDESFRDLIVKVVEYSSDRSLQSGHYRDHAQRALICCDSSPPSSMFLIGRIGVL